MRRFIRRTTTTITSATVTSTTTRHRSRSASVTTISHRHAVRHHHATRSRFHIWKGRPPSAAPSLTTSAPLGKVRGEAERSISSRSRRSARQHLHGQTGASVRSHHRSADTLQGLPQPARKDLVGASRKSTVHHVAGVGAVRDDAYHTGTTKEPLVEQLSDEEERLSHRRQLTRAVIADDRTEREGRKGRPPPNRLRADDRPKEGDERISSKIHCILLTPVEGNAPARHRSAAIHPRGATVTMGNQNNLLSRSKCRQDGGVERRPSTATTTTTTTGTTRTASSVTTTASRRITSNVIQIAKGGGRPSCS